MSKTTNAPNVKMLDWLVDPVPLKKAVFSSISPIKITSAGKIYFLIRRLRSSMELIFATNLIFFSNGY